MVDDRNELVNNPAPQPDFELGEGFGDGDDEAYSAEGNIPARTE